jgi:predicted DNA-binding protein YlxM (UPF0122 family)
LTEKQQKILNYYYNEEYTLSEIGEQENVSRQAAFDLVRRAENILLDYDGKLNLFEKYMSNKELLGEIQSLCSDNNKVLELINRLNENL